MIKSFVLLAGVGLGLAAVNDAAAQSTAGANTSRPRFFNPFLPRFHRLAINRLGLPQFRSSGAVLSADAAAAPSTPTVLLATGDSAPVAVKSPKEDETAQPVVVRPPFRPPVRSPYRPPPRGPF
jgi:hypothetical protein